MRIISGVNTVNRALPEITIASFNAHGFCATAFIANDKHMKGITPNMPFFKKFAVILIDWYYDLFFNTRLN